MSSANSEQLKAIEHFGGVLLNAGAGSGKTFVLIEHVKYLINQFFKENMATSNNPILLEHKLQQYLSKIVLMTFTNEAAKELKSRLFSKFESQDEFPNSIVYENLKFINVSTIHGFCLKLIKGGFVENAPSDFELKDEYQIELKIKRLVKVWFEDQVDTDGFEIFVKNYEAINDSMSKIFSSPELRSAWRKDVINLELINEYDFFADVLELHEFRNDIKTKVDLSSYADKSNTNWYKYLDRLNTIRDEKISWEMLKKFESIYAEVGRVVAPRGNSDLKEILDDTSKLRKFIKSHQDNFDIYFSNLEHYKKWQNRLSSLFDFVDKNYYTDGSISFADLEFLAFQSVYENSAVQNELAKKYSYFIVDEFQDTSLIQYEILKSCVQNDFSKIFCVGDKKQAIYGFRGGELAVFNDLSKKISANYSMTNNYRSEENVVNFNNDLFSFIFPLGKNFENNDRFSVSVEGQTFPDIKDKSRGKLNRYLINPITNLEKLSNEDISTIEATQICESILDEISNGEDEICILYRSLGPSKYLIEKLIEKKVSFQAQVKIPYGEDPIFILFKSLIDILVKSKCNYENTEKLVRYANFYIEGVLSHFGITKDLVITEKTLRMLIEEFDDVGIEVIFYKFIQLLGISNSLFTQNSSKILQIINSNHSNIDKIWESLKAFDSEKYSTKFNYGLKPKVKIMTTHASKGLQFNSVYLGGIHSNGRSPNNTDFIGNLPGSFRWTPEIGRKKLYQSPMFIYEGLLNSAKDFSESKRLFYVACTRAVKAISWCDIHFGEKPQSHAKSSWINALRMFDSKMINTLNIQVGYDTGVVDKAPIYFKDDLGISLNANGSLGLISELSVTSLALLPICSRKFYIKQLMKIEDEWTDYAIRKDISIPQRTGISDKDRGIRIHKILENYINNLENAALATDEKEILDWFASEFKQYKENCISLYSEREMKFSLFGQMITGIADLIIQVSDGVYEIWDFKTGLENLDLQKSYDFQLMCYAYGLSQVDNVISDKNISMKTIYLDERKIKTVTLSLFEIRNRLSSTWQKLSDYSYKQNSHCDICEYGNLCHS